MRRHIGKGKSIGKPSVDNSLNSRISDQVRILNWIVNTAIFRNVNRLILTGDVFDEVKPDNNLIVILIDWLYVCSSHNIDVHIISGNHDLKRVGDRYSSVLDIIESSNIPGVFIYNKIYTLNTEGVSFTMVPFRDKRSLSAKTVPEAIQKISQCFPYEVMSMPYDNDKVMIGHLAIEKSFFTDEIDDVSNEIMMPIESFSEYDYVWMGHVHKPQVLNKSPYIAHIGSMDISDFGETNQEKIVILYDPSTQNKFEEIKIPTRPLRRIRLEIPKSNDPTEYLINEINRVHDQTSFKGALVKLEITILDPEAPELDRDKVYALLKDLGTYFVSNFSESRKSTVVTVEKKHIEDSAIKPKSAVKLWADLLEYDDESEKTELIDLCNSIIDELTIKMEK